MRITIAPYNSAYYYDDSGMLTNLSLSNGDAWTWDYDAYCGRLIKQTCAPYQSGHTMVSSYSYSADDKIKKPPGEPGGFRISTKA